jgi:bacteriorhodopsin
MKLLSSDQGTIVMGVTAAYSTGGVKAAFFTAGVCYGMTTFYTAFLVYAEAFENVPEGKCKMLVTHMVWTGLFAHIATPHIPVSE